MTSNAPAAAFLATVLLAGAAAAQDTATPEAGADSVAAPDAAFEIELNAAATTEEGNCRLTYVATNASEAQVDRAAYELAVFDAQGIVNQLLAFDLGTLVAGKTKVLRFDLAGGCDDISRILVNDVLACEIGGDAASGMCLDNLSTASRADIRFGI